MYALNKSLETSLWSVQSPTHQLEVSRRAAKRSAVLQALAEQDPGRRERRRRPWAWARSRVTLTKPA